MNSPLPLHAGPSVGFDQPFEMLAACHERVEHMLRLLERLAQHLLSAGCDSQARQAAVDVMRYFDLAGPAHHEDEERHVFPALRAGGDAALCQLVERLHQQHLEMAQQWARVRADLAQVAAGVRPGPAGAGFDGSSGVDADVDGAATNLVQWDAFARLYRGHIEAEEAQAYPAARARLGEAALPAIGREMAGRRGQR